MMEDGKMTKLLVKEFIIITMEVDSRGNLKMERNTVMELFLM